VNFVKKLASADLMEPMQSSEGMAMAAAIRWAGAHESNGHDRCCRGIEKNGLNFMKLGTGLVKKSQLVIHVAD